MGRAIRLARRPPKLTEKGRAQLLRIRLIADELSLLDGVASPAYTPTLARNERRNVANRVLPLTRLDLDPYDLNSRFKDAPHQYAVTLAQLSESLVHVNLGNLAPPRP